MLGRPSNQWGGTFGAGSTTGVMCATSVFRPPPVTFLSASNFSLP